MKSSIAVPLYLPNLICYVRLAQTIACLFLFREHPLLVFSLLILATVFDGLDGYVAVRFQQTSQYGAVLDYLIDRVHTILLITFLVILYPQYTEILSIILVLDISSHLARLYSTIFSGTRYHKDVESNHFLLRMYYAPTKNFMRFTCFSYDLFLCLLFLGHAIGFPPAILTGLILALPGFIVKNSVHVLQAVDCFSELATAQQG